MFKPSNKVKLLQKENDMHIHPIHVSSYVSTKSTFDVEKVPQATSTLAPDSFPLSHVGKISPIVLLMIIILAAIFFILSCLHLLFRYLVKTPPSRSLFNSNRLSYNTDNQASTHVLQRQLQQLFRLHDSGLDQSYIDSLPIFHYKDVLIGLDLNMKQQFDCAVCLSEFSNQDKLKLLPLCSHAFHINCIDPWLMSNSTCPICRTTLLNPPLASLPQLTIFHDSTKMSLSLSTGIENPTSTSISNSVSSSSSATLDEKRVYSIRLGELRTLSNNDSDISTNSKLDGRRCYSMGSYQYIVTHDSYLKVPLDLKLKKVNAGMDGDGDGDGEGHCVSIYDRSSLRGDSFSESKIWLWSNKRKYEDHHYCDSKIARLGRPDMV